MSSPMEDAARQFGDRLQTELDRRKLKGAQFGRLVGVSSGTVSRWTNGIHFPDAETVLRIEAALELEPGTVYRWAGLVREPRCAIDLSGLSPRRRDLIKGILRDWGELPNDRADGGEPVA